MILKALYDYYELHHDEMPPINQALTDLRIVIVISKNGDFLGFETYEDEPLSILTFRPEERTSAPVPHCMCDNGAYVLGLKDVKPGKTSSYANIISKNKKNHDAFLNDIKNIHDKLPYNIHAQAVYDFYEKYDENVIRKMEMCPNWTTVCKLLDKNITFRIDGTTVLAANDPDIIQYKTNSIINDNIEKICLITGNKARPVATTYSTFIIGGKSNAKLVSFQVNSGYDSYGKSQGLNAPISQDAEFKFTTALLHLLAKNSRNKFMVGSRTFVFWCSKDNNSCKEVENGIYSIFGFTDDASHSIESVRKVFKSIYSGEISTTLDERFYILGLAPNAARISVSYWADIHLHEFAGIILKHFHDMEIIDNRGEKKPYYGLYSLMAATTATGKEKDASPNLAEQLVKSIFQGHLYPFALYIGALNRAKLGQKDISITQASIFKAYLNRLHNNNDKILNVMLDKENTNQGYLCGRLFAVLDKIQYDANKNSSIRERYMNSASATPAAVFSTILNLSSHHAEKLSDGSRTFYEKLKQEIIDKISSDGFPAHLDLHDQGRFFVGYYHQRQDLFSSKRDVQDN